MYLLCFLRISTNLKIPFQTVFDSNNPGLLVSQGAIMYDGQLLNARDTYVTCLQITRSVCTVSS